MRLRRRPGALATPVEPGRRWLSSAALAHLVFPKQLGRRAPFHLGTNSDEDRRSIQLGLRAEDAAFFRWLFGQAGLEASRYRSETLGRRVPACLRALRVRSTPEARAVIERSPELMERALGTALVGVTSFFRDAEVFRRLDEEVIPALAGAREALHAWSAGCSDGAEVYSLAILLAERGLLEKSYLLGTDCRRAAIEKARSGVFDDLAMKAVEPGVLARYFSREGASHVVARSLRARIRWRIADVLVGSEPGWWDLILFRNTAMYMTSEAVETLWARIEATLRPGGVLVLGKAERPAGVRRLVPLAPCLYRRLP